MYDQEKFEAEYAPVWGSAVMTHGDPPTSVVEQRQWKRGVPIRELPEYPEGDPIHEAWASKGIKGRFTSREGIDAQVAEILSERGVGYLYYAFKVPPNG